MAPVVRSVELPNQVKLPYVEQGDPWGIPVVLLHAIADSWRSFERVLPQSDQEALKAAIAGSRLVVYPGAGHAVYWEEPGRVASDLVAFVHRIRGWPAT